MPVYLITAHAYRSWPEDHPNGYVQRDEGLKKPSHGLARWRGQHAKGSPARFGGAIQKTIQDVVAAVALEYSVRLHACATCPTHVHTLLSFRSPACTCGASRYCRKTCDARKFAEVVCARLKRKIGQTIAKQEQTRNRRWLSRGWDMTPVRNRAHFAYLIETYLPEHESRQAGNFRRYA